MSKHLHCFFSVCFDKHINRWIIWNCVININFQVRNTFHQKLSQIYWKYQYYNSIFVFWCEIFVTRFYIHTLYCIYFNIEFFGLHFNHNYKIKNQTRLFGKVKEETEENTVWKSWRGRLRDPAFSTRTVYCFGEDLFECKLTVTLVRIPIRYGKIPSTN